MNVAEAALPDLQDLVVGSKPIDASAAAVVGRWFNMINCDALNILLVKGLGGATENPVITLEQAQDSSGTGAKALTIARIDTKIGNTGFTAATDLWSRVTTVNVDNKVSSYTFAASAVNEGVVNFYVLDTDLDINNGFKYVRASVADVGATAQLVCLLYIPAIRKYQGKHNVSALA